MDLPGIYPPCGVRREPMVTDRITKELIHETTIEVIS